MVFDSVKVATNGDKFFTWEKEMIFQTCKCLLVSYALKSVYLSLYDDFMLIDQIVAIHGNTSLYNTL